jgi:hypothetical protein
VTGVAVSDDVGDYNRWIEDFYGNWEDLYYPKLCQKIKNTTHWREIIDDQYPGSIAEAQMLALNRLLELISISRDHSCTIPLDLSIEIGRTVREHSELKPWLVLDLTYVLDANPPEGWPEVTMELSGTNHEEGAK